MLLGDLTIIWETAESSDDDFWKDQEEWEINIIPDWIRMRGAIQCVVRGAIQCSNDVLVCRSFQMGTLVETLAEETEGALQQGPVRARVFTDLSAQEKERYKADIRATNILLQGLKESNFDQLYAYLKQHEVHANENRTMMERFLQPTNDPLALVSNASVQQYPTQSSKSPQSSNEPSSADNFQLDLGSSSTENLIESLSNSLALLTQSYKSHLPQTNNQLRTSSNARNKATVQDDRVFV
ncbi:hypothetical protein Tco_1278379 [Tanacetum coccineum]